MAFREVCVYNNGERKNHKKAKGHIPSAERKEEVRKGQAKKGQERKGEGQTEIARRFAHENLQEMFPRI
jgi:hypothetical protein